MINNARAESNARSARVGERDEAVAGYRDERDKRAGLPAGDSEEEGGGSGSGYEDEYDSIPGSVPRHTTVRKEAI